jgi:hypothetical protein
MKKTIILIISGLLTSTTFSQEKLLLHNVRMDEQNKLLSWSQSQSPYDDVVCKAWNAFKKIPNQPNGYKTYITYPVFYGSTDDGKNVFEGRDWTHNPASLFGMLTDSAMLYYAYSGDEEVIPLIRQMLDHHIEFGSTEETDDWASVPYASSDGGSIYYRGADERKYQQNEKFLGRGDGIGFIEPDKVGELGLAYLKFYEFTNDEKYCNAAKKCADALVKHIIKGDKSHSPWPFRIDAKTGKIVKEKYTANAVGPIRLLDEMIKLKIGDTKAYKKTRDQAFEWLMKYPVKNNIWTQYFEDIYIYPDYRTNINQYCPMETVRYLLENPQYDPDWQNHCKNIIAWVIANFAKDSLTMAGLPEKGNQWGSEVLSEQINDMDKMSSHTARFASVLALWYEKTGDKAAKERAFRSFNWATYSCNENGLVKTSIDEGTGYWFSDGYGDYMRHFMRGMASVPEWAPSNENHLLKSSSIVRSIKYSDDRIVYNVFDESSTELIKLTTKPEKIQANNKILSEKFYAIKLIEDGSFIVNIRHEKAAEITIYLQK